MKLVHGVAVTMCFEAITMCWLCWSLTQYNQCFLCFTDAVQCDFHCWPFSKIFAGTWIACHNKPLFYSVLILFLTASFKLQGANPLLVKIYHLSRLFLVTKVCIQRLYLYSCCHCYLPFNIWKLIYLQYRLGISNTVSYIKSMTRDCCLTSTTVCVITCWFHNSLKV